MARKSRPETVAAISRTAAAATIARGTHIPATAGARVLREPAGPPADSSAAHSPRFPASTKPAASPKRFALRIAWSARYPNATARAIRNGRAPPKTTARAAAATPSTPAAQAIGTDPRPGTPSQADGPGSAPNR